jgi:ribulose-phosphate 3-epimerase
MTNQIYIAPSVLAADFGNLTGEIASVVEAKADWIHIDVMDGCFVPPITFGGDKVTQVAKSVKNIFCDVHLMIVEPERQFEALKKAGADRIIVHQEACPHLHRVISQINSMGIKSGVAVNPGTPVETLLDVLDIIDLALVMTVNPGWGGQPFINSCLNKIKTLSSYIQSRNLKTIIEVDGGVDDKTAILCKQAGATALVAGSYVFNSKDRAKAIQSLRN